MISKQRVQHVAKLARVELTEQETERFRKDLAEVLEYFEILKEVDVSDAEASQFPSPLKNVVRQDRARQASGRRLLDLAPETKNGYLKVKSMF